jgi:hypothetical protein
MRKVTESRGTQLKMRTILLRSVCSPEMEGYQDETLWTRQARYDFTFLLSDTRLLYNQATNCFFIMLPPHALPS